MAFYLPVWLYALGVSQFGGVQNIVAFIEDNFKISAKTGPDTFGGRSLAALRVSRLLNLLSIREQVQVVDSYIRQLFFEDKIICCSTRVLSLSERTVQVCDHGCAH